MPVLLLAGVLVDGMLRPAGRFGCIDTSDPRLPDEEAAAFMRDNGVRGRMLTWFNWGEYAIWHFAPQAQVSMDGRRETIYSDSLIRAHLNFYFNEGEAALLLKRLNPNYIWLPADVPAVGALDAQGWRRAFAGKRSVIFQRSGAARPVEPSKTAETHCFPG